ncbi:unnamed protein product [Adineta steineri]|uniref:Uncharacterized protein n=2 Tax=Adineta steineri TaxID=433720 RepID=A0A818NUS7_9BILA|nr:unnamed protein product [Adineta steineri]CAF0947294.1 unnamed protein product [Adineta steineri]CAF0952919.1 unnamed protein product [Adineta steineri]CAF3610483.1 unnamed protein product [Adineta steineri]CAF4048942.1 unnamed protein product [Adineta steineri]
MQPTNLQAEFKLFWNKQNQHQSLINYYAVAGELKEYPSKQLTMDDFNIDLDPDLYHTNNKEKYHREA